MAKRNAIFAASAAIASLALGAGAALVAACGFAAPRWLLAGLLSAFSLLVLLGGFTSLIAAAMPWLMLRPVRGAALVVAGVACMYIPPQFVASAVFLTLGIRLVVQEIGEETVAQAAAAVEVDYDASLVDAPDPLPLGHRGTSLVARERPQAIARRD